MSILRPNTIAAAVAVALGASLSTGCAHSPAPPTQRAPSPNLTGVWDWVLQSSADGDLRVEQEEWHLQQQGGQIHGYYDRAVTFMSTDDRLFRCNQRLGFTRQTRVRVAGVVEGDRIHLEEIGFDAKPSACDDGARTLVRYRGVLRSGALRLEWAADGAQTLHRREDSRPRAIATPGSRSGSTAPISGAWSWRMRSIDAEGDERAEHEQWQLDEGPEGISGSYLRTVERIRGEGIFPCSGTDRFSTTTRFSVRGAREGDRVMLTETDFRSEPASRCDNGLRRLDSYRGTLSADGQELVLTWGSGSQVLRRAK